MNTPRAATEPSPSEPSGPQRDVTASPDRPTRPPAPETIDTRERGDRVAKAQALAWTTALVPISLLMIPVGAAGWFYGVVALALGLWFGLWAWRGLRDDSGHDWARGFFRVSLVYLPVLALALVLDHSLL